MSVDWYFNITPYLSDLVRNLISDFDIVRNIDDLLSNIISRGEQTLNLAKTSGIMFHFPKVGI